jgi:outer membrane protein assembly factor BamB
MLQTDYADDSIATSPENFELIAKNRLGEDVYATPAVCGGHIYLRVAQRTGDVRQEWLYAIAE